MTSTERKIELEDWVKEGHILVEDEEYEKKFFTQIRRERRDSKFLDLFIYPTLKCNFSCTYCYQNGYDRVDMNNEIMKSTVDFISNQIKENSLKKVNITWIGGEPLLATEVIEEFYLMLKGKVKLFEQKVEIDNFVVTNGYLMTKDVILNLFNILDVKNVQITLDGLKSFHNKRRTNKKNDSYSRILANIDSLIQFRPNTYLTIRSNIDKSNKDEFPKLYKEITNRYPNNDKIRVEAAFVEDYSLDKISNNEHILSHVEQGEFNLKMFKEFSIENVNFLPQSTAYSCLAKLNNSYAIGPSGYVYKCTALVGQKQFAIFNIKNSEILNEEFLSDFYEAYDYLNDKECEECSFFPSCNGGCTIQRLKKKYLNVEAEKCPPEKLCLEKYLVAHVKGKYNEEI